MLLQIKSLLVKLETQRDLISYDYSFGFEDEPGRKHGGGTSGFQVEGGFGSIDVRPAGYCDLTISDVGPNGRGRIVAIIDMRVRREFQTLERGKLRCYQRKAVVGWFDALPGLIDFLTNATEKTVDVVHLQT